MNAGPVAAEVALPPFRQRPAVTVDDEAFWRSGADGVLRMQRCQTCEQFQQPPSPICFRCASRDLAFEPVSGMGTVHTYTVNNQPWLPHLLEPHAIIVVELDEQVGLRFMTRLVDTPVDDVEIGMAVRVVFEPLGEGLFAPYFTAAETEKR